MTNQKEDCFLLGCASYQSGWPLSHKSTLHCPANDAGTFLPCQLALGYACQQKALEGHREAGAFSSWFQGVLSFGMSATSPLVSPSSLPKVGFPASFAIAAPQQTPLPFSRPRHALCSKSPEESGVFPLQLFLTWVLRLSCGCSG